MVLIISFFFIVADKPAVKCTCHMLSDIVRSASGEGTTSRKVVYNSVQGHIDLCSAILTAYVTDAGRYLSVYVIYIVYVRM